MSKLIVKKKKRGLPPAAHMGCPLTHNLTPWCFRLCRPDDQGKGHCGRFAAHALKGRTNYAIEAHNRKKLSARISQIKRQYLAAARNKDFAPKINIEEGSAEIIIPVQKRYVNAAGG